MYTKKIIIGVVGILVVGVLGRAGWAFIAVRKDMAIEEARKAELLVAKEMAAAQEAADAAVLASIPKAPEGCPETKQTGEVWITGKVTFPKGVKASADYFATNGGVTYPINPDGTFCVVSVLGQTALVTASATSTKNSFVLSALFNSNSNPNDFIINATSTAMSLVYSSPLVGPGSSPNILDAIATSTSVLKFATSISAATTLSSSDLATGGKLVTAYNAAVKSVQPKTVVPSKTTPVVKSVTQITKPPAITVTTPKPVVNNPTATTTPIPTTPATTTAAAITTTPATEPVIIDTSEAFGI